MMRPMDDDTTDPWTTRPGWERRYFRASMVGLAVELLALVVWPFAPHGNGWAVASVIGSVLFLGGSAADALHRRRHRP